MIFFLIFFILGLGLPQLLPVALLFSCSADLMMPWGNWMVYSNEWALFGAAVGLGMRRLVRLPLAPLPENIILASLPPLLVIFLHALWPGPVGASLKDLLRALEFMAGLLLPAWLLEGRAIRRSLWAFALFALLAQIYGIVQHFAGPDSTLNAGHTSEAFGTFQAACSFFQHHNQFGAFLVASTPSLALLLNPFLALPALLAIFCSYSRGALLALVLGVFAMAPFYTRNWRRILGLAFILGLLLIFALPSLRLREASIFRLGQNHDRVIIWTQGLAIWDGAWIWGQGAGSVKAQLPARIEALELPAEDKLMFQAHLHNQWLQWGVEYGLLGLLAWLCFFAALFLGALQSARWAEGWQRLSGIALGIALIAFSIQQSTDLLMLHARGLQIALFWGLCLAGMKALPQKELR